MKSWDDFMDAVDVLEPEHQAEVRRGFDWLCERQAIRLQKDAARARLTLVHSAPQKGLEE